MEKPVCLLSNLGVELYRIDNLRTTGELSNAIASDSPPIGQWAVVFGAKQAKWGGGDDGKSRSRMFSMLIRAAPQTVSPVSRIIMCGMEHANQQLLARRVTPFLVNQR